MSSDDSNPQNEQQNSPSESQRPGPNISDISTSPNHATAPGYTKFGPPKNLLKPIQPSASYNPITLPPLTTDNSLDPEVESSGQAVSGQRWEVKPRPRPGRKLATDAPDTKRKQQNREAQRAFRERRAQRVSELETELQKLKAEHQKSLLSVWQNSEDEKSEFMRKWRENFGGALEDSSGEKARMIEQLRRKDEELLRKEAEIQYWKDKANKSMGIDTQLTPPPYASAMGHPFSNPGPSSAMPPSMYPSMHTAGNMGPPTYPRGSFSEGMYGSSNFRPSFPDPYNFRPSLPDPRAAQQAPGGTGGHSVSGFGGSTNPEDCGNCTGDQCPCVDELVDDSNSNIVRHPSAANPSISPTDSRTFAHSGTAADVSEREIDFTNVASRQTTEQSSEPGSCTNCQTNPDQKMFCQALDQAAGHADESRQMKAKDPVAGQTIPPAFTPSISGDRMSCDETYNVLFPNRNFSLDSNYSEFMNHSFTLTPSRRDSGLPDAPQRTALDVECASVLDYMRSSGSVPALNHPRNSGQPRSSGQPHPQDQEIYPAPR